MNSNTQKIAAAIILLLLIGGGIFWSRIESPSATSAAFGQSNRVVGLVDRINKGELHAGYGVYPPYSQEDPNTKKVSGFSVELIEEIGRQLGVKVVWHRINWNTMAADLKRGEFDVIADPIFLTIPRAKEFEFSIPYAYFADEIAVVRRDEQRVQKFEDLGKPGLKIVVGKGFAAKSLLRARFPKANIVSILTGSDLLQLYNEVITGRADIAVNDGADAERFTKEHPTQVKALFLDNPPAFTPAGFVLRQGDYAGANFLTVSLRNLEGTGVVKALADRYGVRTSVSTQR